jgi:hypothetical protein
MSSISMTREEAIDYLKEVIREHKFIVYDKSDLPSIGIGYGVPTEEKPKLRAALKAIGIDRPGYQPSGIVLDYLSRGVYVDMQDQKIYEFNIPSSDQGFAILKAELPQLTEVSQDQ